jgi:nitroreductase
MLRELILKNRSYRRFHQDVSIDINTLRSLVDLARLSASAANLQPIRYILSCDPRTNAEIFRHLLWAGYLRDWPGPEEGERPAGYIIILRDTRLSPAVDCDHGIAAQSILLGATEAGLGGCIIGSILYEGLMEAFSIPEEYEILLVLALGKPKEVVILEEVGPQGEIKYWRDEQGHHHVPKRSMDELILKQFGPEG